MFVIYLNTNSTADDKNGNDYGYYAGKTYCVQGQNFPITDSGITERTKLYKSEKVARRSAETVYRKCGYISTYKIEVIK